MIDCKIITKYAVAVRWIKMKKIINSSRKLLNSFGVGLTLSLNLS